MNTATLTPHSQPSFAPAPGEAAVLLSPQQLAKKLGICRRSLANWTRNKTLPMIKIGRVCRFDFARVCAVLQTYERPAVPGPQAAASSSARTAAAGTPAAA